MHTRHAMFWHVQLRQQQQQYDQRYLVESPDIRIDPDGVGSGCGDDEPAGLTLADTPWEIIKVVTNMLEAALMSMRQQMMSLMMVWMMIPMIRTMI